MSKKNRKNGQTQENTAAETNTAPVAEQDAPAQDAAPEQTTAQDEPKAPAKVLRYSVLDIKDKKFRRGFETALITELQNGPGTAEELCARLLASGEYQKVAPVAAANRPLKPLTYLLNLWVQGKRLSAEEIDAPALAEPTTEERLAELEPVPAE